MKKLHLRMLIFALVAILLLTSCMQQPIETQPPETQATTAPTTVPTTAPPVETTEPPAKPAMNVSTVFQDIFVVNKCMTMELRFADGTGVGPYTTYRQLVNLKLLMPDAVTEIEAPDLSSCTEWLVFSSQDGSVRLTVYRGTPDILCYEKDGSAVYYQAAEGEEQFLRSTFDATEKYALGRVVFSCSGSAEQALQTFAETAYPEYRNQMAQGSIYRFTEYQVVDVSLEETEDAALLGKFTYVAKPERSSFLMGELLETGEYAGWYRFEERVALEQRIDGNWYEIPAAEYAVLYQNDYPPFDPEAVEVSGDAVEYLAQLPELLETQQAAASEEELRELAETFLRTTAAVPMAAATDFDWSLFCTEEALGAVGMQAMLKYYVEREGATGYFTRNLKGDLPADVVCMDAETALVAHYQVQICFTKVEGKWMIDDVALPFLGT